MEGNQKEHLAMLGLQVPILTHTLCDLWYTAMLPARELLNPKQNTWQLNPLAAEILKASLGCASAFEQRVSQQVDAEQLILPA